MNNNTTKTKNNSVKKIFSVIGNILITVYVIAVLLFSVSVFTSMQTGYPSVFGYTALYVKTDSMESDAEDAIFTGDLVICKEQDNYKTLQNGEIIAYKATVYQEDDSGKLNDFEIVKVHRIIGKDEAGVRYITCGDNSPDTDGDGLPDPDATPVNPDFILGVYKGTRIPGVGSAFEYIQGQNGILYFLVIPMAAFFIYALFKFVKAMIEYKLEKATSGAPADGEITEEQKQAAIAEYLAKQAAEANKDENNTDNASQE